MLVDGGTMNLSLRTELQQQPTEKKQAWTPEQDAALAAVMREANGEL